MSKRRGPITFVADLLREHHGPFGVAAFVLREQRGPLMIGMLFFASLGILFFGLTGSDWRIPFSVRKW